jgi:DNA-binding response OmpR family regulator
MAATTLAATLSIPTPELRSPSVEQIVIIEHDVALRKILQRLFSLEGYAVDVVRDAVCGLKRLQQQAPAAVILDLPRAGSSGCDLCKTIANLIPSPLVILSGSSDVVDKVLLLELGADDYVTIPFSPRELVARLRALIRRASRSSPEDADVHVFADVTVDFFKTEITRCGKKIMVTLGERPFAPVALTYSTRSGL